MAWRWARPAPASRNPLVRIDAAANERAFARSKLVARVAARGIRGGPPAPRGRLRARGREARGEVRAAASQARYHVPVVFVDETLTSAAAEASLRRQARAARREAATWTPLAAAIILQSYLDDPEADERAAS